MLQDSLCTLKSAVSLPLRVSVLQVNRVLRPAVGLIVRGTDTMNDIYEKGLSFPDRHRPDDRRVMEWLDCPVDATLCSRAGEEFNVLMDTVVADAWLFGEFNSVKFSLAQPVTQVSILHYVLHTNE